MSAQPIFAPRSGLGGEVTSFRSRHRVVTGRRIPPPPPL